jgi:hypothetical protein
MKKASSPNIVCLLDVLQTPNNTYIVTEYCNGGDLREFLKKKKYWFLMHFFKDNLWIRSPSDFQVTPPWFTWAFEVRDHSPGHQTSEHLDSQQCLQADRFWVCQVGSVLRRDDHELTCRHTAVTKYYFSRILKIYVALDFEEAILHFQMRHMVDGVGSLWDDLRSHSLA